MKIESVRPEKLSDSDKRVVRNIINKMAPTGSAEEITRQDTSYVDTPEENLLKQSRITPDKLEPMEGDELERGSNINFITELNDGTRGFLKLFDPDSTNVSYPEPEKMERASYVLSRIMGFNLIPTTIIKKVSTRGLTHPKLESEDRNLNQIFGRLATGSLQQFIENTKKLEDVGEDSISKSRLLPLYILDYVTANWDRHTNNVLIDENGNIHAIDNESSFFELDKDAYYSLINNLQKIAGEPIPESVYRIFHDFQVNKTKREILHKELSKVLSEEYITAAFSRINQIGNLILNNQTLTGEKIGKLRIR